MLFAVIDIFGSIRIILSIKHMGGKIKAGQATYRFERFLGPTGLMIVKKFFEIILLAIAIKLFLSNTGIKLGAH